MIKIKPLNSYDKKEIYSFILLTKHRKFNLWPNVTNSDVAKFLTDDIFMINNKENVLIASIDSQIIAILAFKNLEWDTKHFGFKCVKIEYLLLNNSLNNSLLEISLETLLVTFQKYSKKNKIKFVSISIDSWDNTSNIILQKHNFRYILSWIDGVFNNTIEIPQPDNLLNFGLITLKELDHFNRLSSISYFKGGRFFFDVDFKKHLVEGMYANLIESSFENKDIMLVYRIESKPVGLLICKSITNYKSFSNLHVAPLRFLLVDPKYRNKSIASKLYSHSLFYLSKKSDLITTGLEIHNLPSLNLHSKFGFKFNYTHNAYHLWL